MRQAEFGKLTHYRSRARGSASSSDSFPFAFGVVLDREARLKDVTRLEVDTSSWSGAADARDGAGDHGRPGYAPAEAAAAGDEFP